RHAEPSRAVDDVVLDAPAGNRADNEAVVADRKHGALGAWRAAPRLDDGHEQHAAAAVEPLGAALEYFEIDTVHGRCVGRIRLPQILRLPPRPPLLTGPMP